MSSFNSRRLFFIMFKFSKTNPILRLGSKQSLSRFKKATQDPTEPPGVKIFETYCGREGGPARSSETRIRTNEPAVPTKNRKKARGISLLIHLSILYQNRLAFRYGYLYNGVGTNQVCFLKKSRNKLNHTTPSLSQKQFGNCTI